MTWTCLAVTAALVTGLAGQSPAADLYRREDIRIPLPGTGAHSLEALLVRSNEPGRYPLALITHGSPRSLSDRPNMSPLAMLPQAIEFARRGWAAVVLMRRGYGGSGGGWAEDYGPCAGPRYIAAGAAAAADLEAAIASLGSRPDIDTSRVISAGVSAGGFATVALAADAPPGLAAAINFAGGRGSPHDNEVCREDRLVEAYRFFGKRARIPMLWVYAENDLFRTAIGGAVQAGVCRRRRQRRVHPCSRVRQRRTPSVFASRHPGMERAGRWFLKAPRSGHARDAVAAAAAAGARRADRVIGQWPQRL